VTSVRSVAYTPARRADLVGLMSEVWDDAEAGEHVEWLFDRSPVEPGLIELAEVDGALAGTIGFSFVRMLVGGERTLAAVVVRIASHPDHRGRGVFTHLLREGEEESRTRGAAIGLTMPNAASQPLLLGRGWRTIGGRRVWVRPLRPRAAPDRPRPPARSYAGVSIAPLERFGAAEELAAERAGALYGDHVVLDADYLNWRYVDAPHSYRCFSAGTDGFAVVRRMRRRGLDTGVLCVVAAGTARVTRALLARSADELRGVQVLTALRPSIFVRAWLSAGFVPTTRVMAPLGKALVAGAALPESPGLQFGDYDFV
jgi:GNAT superfamily N-acetyltransferase